MSWGKSERAGQGQDAQDKAFGANVAEIADACPHFKALRQEGIASQDFHVVRSEFSQAAQHAADAGAADEAEDLGTLAQALSPSELRRTWDTVKKRRGIR